jgi:hypothetical protein
MYMHRLYLSGTIGFFLGSILFLLSCRSTNKVIKQTHAFSVTLYPGIVAVDEHGKELPSSSQTKYLVYAVTGSDKIKWDTAWINGRVYTINAEKINPSPVFEVGIDKQTGNKIAIITGETENLYLLHLNPVSITTKTDAHPLKELKIKATYKRKEVNLSISGIKELATPDPV